MKRNLIYHTHVPAGNTVKVITEEGASFQTELTDISRDGMNMRCDKFTLEALIPRRNFVAPKQAVSLKTEFSLSDTSNTVVSLCHVVSVRRLSRDTFQVQLKICEIDENYFENLNQFIEQNLNDQTSVMTKVA